MFIGHYAVALAAKRYAPRTSLGTLFAATQLPDLVWPVCVLLGWEQVEIVPGVTAFNPLAFTSYPWSHSLLLVAGWGIAAGVGWYLWQRDARGALAVAMLAVSHWVLDWITHRPDLPLWPGASPKLGLSLWQSVPGTLLLEGGMFAAGTWLYFAGTAATDRSGRWGVASLLGVLAAFYIADRFGTPPPNSTFLGWFALVGGLLPVAWAAWADRHRQSKRRD